MNAPRFTISDEIFRRFPGYVRGVVVAHGLSNRESPEELVRLLREAEEAARGKLNLEQLAEHPRIKSWRDAYRSFGARPSDFRSSVEALARRVLRGEPLPRINALVDIGTTVSLLHVVPAGGHAIDVLTGDIALRLASGEESFVALGAEQVEQPLAGEVVFVEGDTVLTRRWTWRQARHTSTVPGTRAIEFNVDGLPPVPAEEIEQACREIMELVTRFCGGSARIEMLTRDHPGISLGATERAPPA